MFLFTTISPTQLFYQVRKSMAQSHIRDEVKINGCFAKEALDENENGDLVHVDCGIMIEPLCEKINGKLVNASDQTYVVLAKYQTDEYKIESEWDVGLDEAFLVWEFNKKLKLNVSSNTTIVKTSSGEALMTSGGIEKIESTTKDIDSEDELSLEDFVLALYEKQAKLIYLLLNNSI